MDGAYRSMPIHHHTWLLLKSLNIEQLYSICLSTWNLQLSIHNHLNPILKIFGHASLHAIWAQHSILHTQKLMALLFRDIHHRLSIKKKNHCQDKQAPCSQRMNLAAKTFPTMTFKGLILFSFLRKALETSTRISALYNMAACRDMANPSKKLNF